MKSDSIDLHAKEKLNALSLLANARRFFGNFQGSISASVEAIEMARSLDSQSGEFSILLNMAKTAFEMGDREAGYGYIDRIISSGADSDNAKVLANVSAAYGVKVIELYTDNRFREGLEEGRQRGKAGYHLYNRLLITSLPLDIRVLSTNVLLATIFPFFVL